MAYKSFFIILICLFASCNEHETPIKVDYFGIRLFLFKNIKETISHLEELHEEIEYNDSYAGEENGIKLFYFTDKRDSIIIYSTLYFYDEKLVGIGANFASKEIEDRNYLQEKVMRNIGPIIQNKSDNINVDTFTDKVSSSESASGITANVRVYSKQFANKIIWW